MGQFPSRDHQFKPGEPSANPAGRPRGRSFDARLRELLEADTWQGKPLPEGRQLVDLLAERVAQEVVLKGNYKLIGWLVDRAYGKVPDVVEGSPDRPLRIVVEYVDGNTFGDPAEPPQAPPGPGEDRPGGEEI